MYFGTTFTTTVTASIARAVRCVHCGETYLYDLRRHVRASSFSPFGLTNDDARGHAQEAAHERASADLHRGVDPVPCPTCGLYQPDMVRRLKWDAWSWLLWAALPFLLLTLLAGIVWVTTRVRPEWLGNLAAGAGAPGAGLLVLWGMLTAWHNPNRGDAARRRAIGWTRAYRPGDAGRLSADRQYRQAAETLSAAAGQNLGWLMVCGLAATILLGAAVGTGWMPARALAKGVSLSSRPLLARSVIPFCMLCGGLLLSYLAARALGGYRRMMKTVRTLETRQTWRGHQQASTARVGV